MINHIYKKLHHTNRMDTNKTVVVSFNVNDDPRLNGPEGIAFPEYKFSHRAPMIASEVGSILASSKQVIVCLFELCEASCDILCSLISYPSMRISYNLDVSSFYFLLFVNDRLLLDSVTILPLTTSGKRYNGSRCEPYQLGYNEFIEEVLGDKFEKTLLKITINNLDVYITQLGSTEQIRYQQGKRLMEYVNEVSYDDHYILCGDFNAVKVTSRTITLDEKLIDIINEGTWLTDNIKSTCKRFPYDILHKCTPPEKELYKVVMTNSEALRTLCLLLGEKYGNEGGPLDHVFASYVERDVTILERYALSDHSMIIINI